MTTTSRFCSRYATIAESEVLWQKAQMRAWRWVVAGMATVTFLIFLIMWRSSIAKGYFHCAPGGRNCLQSRGELFASIFQRLRGRSGAGKLDSKRALCRQPLAELSEEELMPQHHSVSGERPGDLASVQHSNKTVIHCSRGSDLVWNPVCRTALKHTQSGHTSETVE